MVTIDMLRQKMQAAGKEICEAVDMSVELRRQSPEVKSEVIKIWEGFLGDFFGYIKQRSKESKDNLLAGMSWTRLKLF